ncbi:MAG: ABC transporter permease, partial [Candidatus Binatia bacterium]
MMFSGLWAILKKEVIHIKRDPATRFIFAIPLFELLLFGYAIDTDVKHVPTVVFDLNRQLESRQLVQEFENTHYFRLVGEVQSDQELQDAIIGGRAKVGIKIPPDYSTNLVNGRQGQVQVIIDGSDSTIATRVLNASQQLGFVKSLERDGISTSQFSIDIRPRLLFNPNLLSANFYVPGLIGIILQLVTVYAAGLYGVNPFDQPGVEAGKKLTYGYFGRPGFEAEGKALREYEA